MGKYDVKHEDNRALRRFTRQLIRDVRALEFMLTEDLFETGIRRVGVEQELFLVDSYWQPAPVIEDVMAANEDDRIVTELTRFNLEFNLDPQVFGEDCLSQMERNLNQMLDKTRRLVGRADAKVAMTGILPTIHISDLTLDNMTPKQRYYALNEAINKLRGGPGRFHIRGVDELMVKHDSIMLEGCNTSFQTHFQVAPEEFPYLYNIAQVVAAPCLSVAVNSPLLFGKRLWHETRIALFQQAVDTRSSNLYLREMSPRVHFGSDWVDESVLEIFEEDISRFRVLITAGETEDPFEALEQGRVPKLEALQLHNGTIYRWNRSCYGIYDGKPHLRIENRILPAGPTVADEVANGAFWFGLVSKLSREYDDIREVIDFDDAKSNFIAAARLGLGARFTWTEGRHVSAHELILSELLPMAREGLEGAGIDAEDIRHYMGIIEERVRTQQTGAQWQLDSLAHMKKRGTRADRLNALVAATVRLQEEGRPVHEWDLADLSEVTTQQQMHSLRVEHHMTTDLFTVHEEELVEFIACLMDWQDLSHVLVEDNQHRLVGLVSHRNVLRYLSEHGADQEQDDGVPVKEIMVDNPISVTPETSTLEAVELMQAHKIGALPVVRDDQLVGLITRNELIRVAGQLMDKETSERITASLSDESLQG